MSLDVYGTMFRASADFAAMLAPYFSASFLSQADFGLAAGAVLTMSLAMSLAMSWATRSFGNSPKSGLCRERASARGVQLWFRVGNGID